MAGTVGALARGPAADHVRAVGGVAGEELCDVADDPGAARAARGAGRIAGADVGGEQGEPLGVCVCIDDLEQRPDEPGSGPRIGAGVEAGRVGDHLADERPRERELDVGGDAGFPFGGGAESVGERLRQPPLHAPAGNGEDRRLEDVVVRVTEDVGQRRDERIGPLSYLEVQHPLLPRPLHDPSHLAHGMAVAGGVVVLTSRLAAGRGAARRTPCRPSRGPKI